MSRVDPSSSGPRPAWTGYWPNPTWLSLASHLSATGTESVSIVVTVHGVEYALDLRNLSAKTAEQVSSRQPVT